MAEEFRLNKHLPKPGQPHNHILPALCLSDQPHNLKIFYVMTEPAPFRCKSIGTFPYFRIEQENKFVKGTNAPGFTLCFGSNRLFLREEIAAGSLRSPERAVRIRICSSLSGLTGRDGRSIISSIPISLWSLSYSGMAVIIPYAFSGYRSS